MPYTEESAEQDVWTRYGDYDKVVFEETVRRGGGGGGKGKKRHKRGSSERARKQAIANSQERRREESKERIMRVLQRFQDIENQQKLTEALGDYLAWLNLSLDEGTPFVDEKDLSETFTRAGTHAGGQNVNKVNSAVQLLHTPTLLVVRSETERSQSKNREEARRVLHERLEEHLDDWRSLLKPGESDPQDFEEVTAKDLESLLE